jgi:hypothetical protein
MTAIPDVINPEPFFEEPESFEVHESSFADMIERLFHQFEARLPLPTIVSVVRDARQQLRGSPMAALPELTERLAIERLTTLAGTAAEGD